MVEINNPVHAKFCKEIEFAAESILMDKVTMFNRKFQNYNTKEKQLDFIHSQIEETTLEINKGIELNLPTKNNVINNIEKSLVTAFRGLSYIVSRANKIDFNPELENDSTVLGTKGTLIISPKFHFYNLSQFDKLITHTANIWFLQELEELEKEISQTSSRATGFDCKIHPKLIVEEIYYLMEERYIRCSLSDFKTIFSNSSNTVAKPIQWLILNERGKYNGRGNKTALNEFLKLMLGKLSNNDRKKAKDLFIDEQGYFIQKILVKPDKSKILTYGFETGIKEILKNADR